MNLTDYSRRIEIAFWTAWVTALRSPRFGRALLQGSSLLACGVLLWSVITWARFPSRSAMPVNAAAAPVEAISRPANGQSNLLLVLVDDLTAARPQLLGTWLLARIPSLPQVTFLPLYPSLDGAGRQFDDRLTQAFVLKANQPLPSGFTQALQAQGFWWNHYLMIDKPGLAALVDSIGGIQLGAVPTEGRAAVAALSAAANNPRTAVNIQAQIAQAVCNRSVEESQETSVFKITSGLEAVAHTDLPIDRLRETLRQFEGAGGFVCQFPTLAGR